MTLLASSTMKRHLSVEAQPPVALTRLHLVALLLTLLFAWYSTAPAATVIYYEVTNLADTTPGSDLWEIAYHVTNFNAAAGQGFSVSFALNLYQDIQSPPPVVNGDWDVISIQPDAGLNSNGRYDAQAVRSMPSLADAFTVEFTWLGTGSPGSQAFEVYDTDFSTIETGLTTTPEPSAIALLALVGAIFASITRWRWRMRRLQTSSVASEREGRLSFHFLTMRQFTLPRGAALLAWCTLLSAATPLLAQQFHRR